MMTFTNHGSAVPMKTGICICGHKERDHMLEYYPHTKLKCRAGCIDASDVGISCTCTQYLEKP